MRTSTLLLVLSVGSAASFALHRPLAPQPLRHTPATSSASALQNIPRVDAAPIMIFGPKEAPVQKLRNNLITTGWLSWWAQAILTTISGVLLLFANSVSSSISTFALIGRAFALGGLGCSIASTLWTWKYSRLAAKLGASSPETTPADAASQVRGLVGFGASINMLGMLLCIVGAEAIVGTLAAKALTTSQVAVLGVTASPVQALDLLIVQANTNIILAHFIALAGGMRVRAAAQGCEEEGAAP